MGKLIGKIESFSIELGLGQNLCFGLVFLDSFAILYQRVSIVSLFRLATNYP
ncbi:hypothetical protein FD46_GL001242 [Liquorilactobacillus oeni DSM 19972]|uniref:Uncharacterized protein n=1 Tax=Liquorilactobacillus oeni DSM 19972 TaxID=1423777 RepID=A0A0R1M7L8_9LACO|nr:hypothetical protein FD46_GL001242 [Liquorilactobacillus oeni DSM 19972]